MPIGNTNGFNQGMNNNGGRGNMGGRGRGNNTEFEQGGYQQGGYQQGGSAGTGGQQPSSGYNSMRFPGYASPGRPLANGYTPSPVTYSNPNAMYAQQSPAMAYYPGYVYG